MIYLTLKAASSLVLEVGGAGYLKNADLKETLGFTNNDQKNISLSSSFVVFLLIKVVGEEYFKLIKWQLYVK